MTARPGDALPKTAEEAFVIEDVATLKVFGDPLRLRFLLEVADEPRTVKDVAAALDVRPTRLYYHLRILERHGLVRVAGRRMVSGIEERSYQATAKSWTINAPLLSSAVASTGVLKSMFDMTAAELELALAGGAATIGDPSGPVPALSLTRLILSPEDVEELQSRLMSLMLDFAAERPLEGKAEYHAFFATYLRPKP